LSLGYRFWAFVLPILARHPGDRRRVFLAFYILEAFFSTFSFFPISHTPKLRALPLFLLPPQAPANLRTETFPWATPPCPFGVAHEREDAFLANSPLQKIDLPAARTSLWVLFEISGCGLLGSLIFFLHVKSDSLLREVF